MKRRNFLKTVAAGIAASRLPLRAAETLPKRTYKGQDKLSVIAFGGIVVCGLEQPDADKIVAEAVERGCNYFDVAPSYFDGEAEIKLGNALRPFRKDAFLACKTMKRDAAGAREELERSLDRLHTDHFDLYQFHAVTTMDDVEKILAPGGAAELFAKAKKEGKTRYTGFSAHNAQAAIALMDALPLDSVLFPVNYVLYSQGHFGPQILEHAKQKGLARLALKSMSQTNWQKGEKHSFEKTWYRPVETPELADKAVRFTLTEDVTAAIPPGEAKLWRMAVEVACRFTPLPAAEREQLLASAQGLTPLFKA